MQTPKTKPQNSGGNIIADLLRIAALLVVLVNIFIADLLRIAALLVVLVNIYFYGYGQFRELGYYWLPADQFLAKLGGSLFASTLYTKVFALFLLLLAVLGNPDKRRVHPRALMLLAVLGGFSFLVGGTFLGSERMSLLMQCFVYSSSSLMGLGMLYVVSIGLKGPKKYREEGFVQNEKKLENEYSIHFQTQYIFKNKPRRGWINVVNPFRASMVLGTPGSGKSFAILIPALKQMIARGFAMYVYDYKFPDLTEIAYNALRRDQAKYAKTPRFCVINFDDPTRSQRCNPIHPDYLEDITDCYESALTVMLNLNKTWITKQGDFFVESPINFLTAIIAFLWKYEGGRYCTFPHVIECLNLPYEQLFPILASYPALENYANPFISAYLQGAEAQLEGQIASAKIGLNRLSSPLLYWVMSDHEFGLDVNNPEDPKVLCLGNNPKREKIYGAALGLYNATIVRLINKKKQLPCGVVIDELPTIYFKGLDTLIATARSNKIACFLGFQDFSQLERDYGRQEATVIRNTVGNIFSGQVVGDSAKFLEDRFGQIQRQRESSTRGGRQTTKSTSTYSENLIPQAAIANISQGFFVGAVSDNFGEEIEHKIFHARILVDLKKLKAEETQAQKIPQVADFGSPEQMKSLLQANYERIKREVKELAEARIAEIRDDPKLAAFFKDNEKEDKKPDHEQGNEEDFGI